MHENARAQNVAEVKGLDSAEVFGTGETKGQSVRSREGSGWNSPGEWGEKDGIKIGFVKKKIPRAGVGGPPLGQVCSTAHTLLERGEQGMLFKKKYVARGGHWEIQSRHKKIAYSPQSCGNKSRGKLFDR